MHSRWTYVATGVMAGIIGVLLTVVISQNRETQAWAAPMSMQAATEGLQMYTGGSQTQDILWIIYKRAGSSNPDAKGVMAKS